MTIESLYEIVRYDVRTETEVLIERVQLLSDNGQLRRRVNDGPEMVCSDTDVLAVSGADPLLSEIRANQVTRITGGAPAVLDEYANVTRQTRAMRSSNDVHISARLLRLQRKLRFTKGSRSAQGRTSTRAGCRLIQPAFSQPAGPLVKRPRTALFSMPSRNPARW